MSAPARERVRLADTALALWRGDPYPDSEDIEPLRLEAVRLAELRLALVESRAAALLELGEPDAAARDLAEPARSHPFRERLWARLALAQYRSGRQAEALDTLRVLRSRLADELGVDPSEEVRRLESDILNQSDRLVVPAAPSTVPERVAPAPPSTFPGGTRIVRAGRRARRGRRPRRAARPGPPGAAGRQW
jgi:DNA-binding SARP family transcriptional activator